MHQFIERDEIIARWQTLPAHMRNTEQQAAGFVLRLVADQPKLAKLPTEQPYKLIKSWLCETLPH